MQKKAYWRIKPIIFGTVTVFYSKMWKISSKKWITQIKFSWFLSFGNIRIIFNVIKKNGIDPFPIYKANHGD